MHYCSCYSPVVRSMILRMIGKVLQTQTDLSKIDLILGVEIFLSGFYDQ